LKPSLVFIGFMGAGKSVALEAAREAGLETVEVDELMERVSVMKRILEDGLACRCRGLEDCKVFRLRGPSVDGARRGR